jgi:hypothetical protein
LEALNLGGKTSFFVDIDKKHTPAGAKLAPFNSGGGGCLPELPCQTDDALQQIFISGHYFSQTIFSRH